MRACLLLLALFAPAAGDAPARVDPALPFRTDSANQHLPWYRIKPGEFPPIHSEHGVDGVLLEADFLHRSGQFRRVDDGVLVDFTLPPFGTVLYLNAEADLRDVPLGTRLHFSTYQDDRGDFSRVANIRDDFTELGRAGLSYRLDEIKPGEGKLVVAVTNPPGAARRELLVDKSARFWRGDKAAGFPDLAVGDALLVNLGGDGRCTEVWAGAEAQKRATEGQRARHKTFIRERGLPAWIDRVEGKKLTVTILGDSASVLGLMKDEGIDPDVWAKEHRSVHTVVANEELRTYNPPVDGKRARVLGYEALPAGVHGCGGVRWVIEPDLLLEGFRKGRVVRLFAHHSWPIIDMPFGETLYSEAPDARPDSVDPNLYPYRVDSGNDHLPWYRPRPGVFPPSQSHHLVVGELVKVDDHGRSGRFRADRTGEMVDFTLPPFGTVMHLNAEADLGDVPPGTRCSFFLHQDDRGEFTRAAVIWDGFTRLADDRLTYRVEALRLDEGEIVLAKQHAPVKNDREEMYRPPDFGRGAFAVDDRTRVWKGDGPATLRDLVVGDEVLLNTTGRTATSRGVCTDLWVGAARHKLGTGRQRAKHDATLKARGIPGWIDRVEGKKLTITFFSGSRKDFASFLNGDPDGESVHALLADDELRPLDGVVLKSTYVTHPPEEDTAGTYGCSGVRWVIEPAVIPEGFRPGRVVRVFKQGWPIEAEAKGPTSAR